MFLEKMFNCFCVLFFLNEYLSLISDKKVSEQHLSSKYARQTYDLHKPPRSKMDKNLESVRKGS